MSQKEENKTIENEEIVFMPEYDEILPPSHHGFIINKNGAVIMSLETLFYEVANENLRKDLENDPNFHIIPKEEEKNGKSDE